LDAEGLSADERLGDLSPGALDDPTERRARNVHARRRRVVVQAIEVGQAQGLELVECHFDHVDLAGASAGRSEDGGGRLSGDPAAATGPGHF
jgi:hypothetical protein